MRRLGDAHPELGHRAVDRGRQQVDDAPARRGVVAITGKQHQERVHLAVVVATIEDAHVSWPMRELDDAGHHAVQLVVACAEQLIDGKALERRQGGASIVRTLGPWEAGANTTNLLMNKWKIEYSGGAHLAREETDEAELAC